MSAEKAAHLEEKEFDTWNEEQFKVFNAIDRDSHPNALIRHHTNKRIRLILKLLNAQDSDTILDLGCGSGQILKRIGRGKITAIDLSDTAVHAAKELAKHEPHIVNVVKGNAENTGFKNNTFDKVICADVIEHVQHPENLIKEAYRITKPGGTVIFAVPNEDTGDFAVSVINILKKIGFRKQFAATDSERHWHLHHTNLNFFKKRNSGLFRIVRVERSPHYFFPITHIIKCRKR